MGKNGFQYNKNYLKLDIKETFHCTEGRVL